MVVAAAVLTLVVVAGAIAVLVGRNGTRYGDDHRNVAFVGSNGLAGAYHLFAAGVPIDEPVGLLVHFHGDGAFEFHNPDSPYALGGPDGIVAAARDHGLIVLAALTPDGRGTSTWWEEGSLNADYARDLIRHVAFQQYDVDPDDIWLVGYSGGAQFITQFLLPKHPDLFGGGGGIVFGGGGPPRVEPAPVAASLRTRFPMHWYTGAEDTGTPPEWFDALDAAERGRHWYALAGFATSIETPDGVGHDGLPFGRVVAEGLTRLRPDERRRRRPRSALGRQRCGSTVPKVSVLTRYMEFARACKR